MAVHSARTSCLAGMNSRRATFVGQVHQLSSAGFDERHDQLGMRLAMRSEDGWVLQLIRLWLSCPVQERDQTRS